MITGFETETAPLNEVEKKAATLIAYTFNAAHIGSEKAVTADHICKAMARNSAEFRTMSGKPYLNGARIRKIVNYIRTNDMCPRLIANSKGYYVSNNKNELTEYISSLYARAAAIEAVARKMEATL